MGRAEAFCLFVLASLLSLPALAERASAAGPTARREGILEEFDADGDGRLSGDELTAAREARRQRGEEGDAGTSWRGPRGAHRRRILERFDSDGDGTLSPEEREQLRGARHERALERFDSDGDGTLSPEERRAARRARREHWRARRGPQPGAPPPAP